jgi:hypothetical protein
MKTCYQSLLLALGAFALAGTAYAQVPTGNDTSDGNGNTGMGTGALGGPVASNGGSQIRRAIATPLLGTRRST